MPANKNIRELEVSLTAVRFEAPTIEARLLRTTITETGLDTSVVEVSPVVEGHARLTLEVGTENGGSETFIDDYRIEFHEVAKEPDKPTRIFATGPLSRLAAALDRTREGEGTTLDAIALKICPDGYEVEVSRGAVVQLLNRCFDEQQDLRSVLQQLLEGQRESHLASPSTFRALYQRAGNHLRRLADDRDIGEGHSLHPKHWLNEGTLRRYILAQQLEDESGCPAHLWFGVAGPKDSKASLTNTTLTKAYVVSRYRRAVRDGLCPKWANLEDAAQDLADWSCRRKRKLDDKLNVSLLTRLPTILEDVESLFDARGLDVQEFGARLGEAITTGSAGSRMSADQMSKALLLELEGFVARQEDQAKQDAQDKRVSGTKKTERRASQPTAEAAEEAIEKAVEEATARGEFLRDARSRLLEAHALAVALRSNVVLERSVREDRNADLRAHGRPLGNVGELALDPAKRWVELVTSEAQRDPILKSLGHEPSGLTKERASRLLKGYAKDIDRRLGELFPNERFVREVRGKKLSRQQEDLVQPFADFIKSPFAQSVQINNYSTRAWTHVAAQIADAELPTDQQKKVEAQVAEFKSWQLAHTLLPDPHEHHKALKLRTILDKGQPHVSGRNPVRALLRLGKTEFTKHWIGNGVRGEGAIISTVNHLEVAEEAKAIFRNAKRQAYYHFILPSGQPESLSFVATRLASPLFVPGPTSPQSSVTWDALFEGKDRCACNHADSVFGPPAYVVDLLNWLRTIPAYIDGQSVTASSVLETLRPDIFHVGLTEQNTTTTLPYLDLVNEVLERRAYSGNLFADPDNLFEDPGDGKRSVIETSGSSQAREIEPEMIHPTVADQVYGESLVSAQGVQLPYDRWLSEARLWLQQAGLELHEVLLLGESQYTITENGAGLAGTRDWGLSPSPSFDQLVMRGGIDSVFDTEYLALSLGEKRLLTGIGYEHLKAYGVAPQELAKDIPRIIAILISSLELRDYDETRYVALFYEILATEYVQATAEDDTTVRVEFQGPDCDISPGNAELTNWTPETFERLFRFCKLLHKLSSWRPWQLDWAIQRSSQSIDSETLRRIVLAIRVGSELELDHETLITVSFGLYSGMYKNGAEPTEEKKHKVVYNGEPQWQPPLRRTVDALSQTTHPSTATMRAYAYWKQGDGVSPEFFVYGETRPALAKHLLVSETELDCVADVIGLDVADELTPEHLREFRKFVELSRALNIPIPTLCRLPRLRANNNIQELPEFLLWLLRYRHRSQALGPYIGTLALFDDKGVSLGAYPSAQSLIRAQQTEVAETLAVWLEDIASVPASELTARYGAAGATGYGAELEARVNGTVNIGSTPLLRELIESHVVEPAWSVLDGARADEVFRIARSTPDAAAQQLFGDTSGHFVLHVSTDCTIDLLPAGAIGSEISEVLLSDSSGASVAGTPAGRYSLRSGEIYFGTVTCDDRYGARVADDKPATSFLHWQYKASLKQQDETAPNKGLSRQQFLDMFLGVALASSRLLVTLGEFGLSPSDLGYLASPATLSPVNLEGLLGQGLSDDELADALDRIAAFAELNKSLLAQTSPDGMVALLQASSPPYVEENDGTVGVVESYAELLSKRTGLDFQLVERFLGSKHFLERRSAKLSNVYQPVYKLFNKVPELLLAEFSSWIARLGEHAAVIPDLLGVEAVQWAVSPYPPFLGLSVMRLNEKKAAATQIETAASAMLGVRRTTTHRQEVANESRVQRRDALVDYLLSGTAPAPRPATRGELESTLLIPVTISSCRTTSRVREAISSIQRFVQQIKHGHINGLYLNEAQRDAWDTFRHSYRVWEAHRKVLLFPSEYLLPSLRTRKTPLFAQAQAELGQDEATQDAAEAVVKAYVKSLVEVASLEVVAVLNHTLGSTQEHITLVFGRTKANPHRYFFCALSESVGSRSWSPWHPVAVDIEGDHLLPVIHRGYLYLFWPDIRVSRDRLAEEEDPTYEGESPQKFEVSLNYTRLDEMIEDEFPNRVKWAKKRQSKSRLEIRAHRDATSVEKLDLASKTHRLQMWATPGQGPVFGGLKIHVGYWEPLLRTGSLVLSYDRDALESTINEILSELLAAEVTHGGGEIEKTLEVLPEDDEDNKDEILKGVVIGLGILLGVPPEIAATAVAAASLAEWVVETTSETQDELYYKDAEPTRYQRGAHDSFKNSWQLAGLYGALIANDLDSAASYVDHLQQLAASFDAGTEFAQPPVTLKSYEPDVAGAQLAKYKEVLTEKFTARSPAGVNLETLINDLRHALDLHYENEFGSRYELLEKGEFVLNNCGELYLSTNESSQANLNVKVAGTESHETPETDIAFHRLYREPIQERLSVYEGFYASGATQQVLFDYAPSAYGLITDPNSIPFRVIRGRRSVFGIQDSKNAFLVLPPTKSDTAASWSLKESPGTRKRRGSTTGSFLRASDEQQETSERGALAVRSEDNRTRKGQEVVEVLYASEPSSVALVGHVLASSPFANILPLLFPWLAEGFDYKLLPLNHTRACNYLSVIGDPKVGVDGLLSSMWNQGLLPQGVFSMSMFGSRPQQYEVTPVVDRSDAEATVYFDAGHLYSAYNRELFFHLVFLIAVNFSDNGEFDLARKWFHYIFDPRRKNSTNAEVWGFLPFRATQGSSLSQKVAIAVADPFNPHAIAEVDPEVYKRAVFHKYIDSLIASADREFRHYTGESLDRARNLYHEALSLLGRPPLGLVRSDTRGRRSYTQLREAAGSAGFDPLGNIDASSIPPESHEEDWNAGALNEVVLASGVAQGFFCTPSSEKLSGYFATLRQRLFNLDHCRDIDGNLREVPLFQPEISPWILVRARAAGLDVGSLLSYRADTAGYRFEFLQSKATEYADLAQRLSDKLQAALERGDSAGLSELREEMQEELLKRTRAIRTFQIADAETNLRQIERTEELVSFRRTHFASQPKINSGEREQVERSKQAFALDYAAQAIDTLSAVLASIPQIGMVAVAPTTEFGGQHLGAAARAVASGVRLGASILRNEAHLAGMSAGRQRRYDDWQFQAKAAARELKQLEQQKLSSAIRINVAELELDSTELQLEQASAMTQALKAQFSNTQFYTWQSGELRSLYRKVYSLAYDMAKRAEAAYRRDTLTDDRYIEPNNWNAEYKGLTGTDRLLSQLKQLDEAYLLKINPSNRVSKRLSLSLSMSFPEELAELKTTGTCSFQLKANLFDVHWPDHFFRRIKSVAITIPGVQGPLIPVNARLTLNRSFVKVDENQTTYPADPSGTASFKEIRDLFRNFAETNDAVQDTGRLQFDDGSRLLNAFEGAGLDHSEWKLDLSREFNSVDLSTVADVVVTFEYTARIRSLSDERRLEIRQALAQESLEVEQLASVRILYPEQWQKFMQGNAAESDVVDTDTILEGLRGVSALQNSKLTAYFVLDNTVRELHDGDTYEVSSNDYDGNDTRKVSLTKLWQKGPNSAEKKAELKDILLHLRGKPS